jgi:hypothetical protein
MMWDTKIREAYNKLMPEELGAQIIGGLFDAELKEKLEELPPCARRNFTQKVLQDMGESYLHFLRISQVIMQALLKHATVAQLWSQHLTFMKDPDFARAWAFSETLAKMIDECNFVRWARQIQFDC